MYYYVCGAAPGVDYFKEKFQHRKAAECYFHYMIKKHPFGIFTLQEIVGNILMKYSG